MRPPLRDPDDTPDPLPSAAPADASAPVTTAAPADRSVPHASVSASETLDTAKNASETPSTKLPADLLAITDPIPEVDPVDNPFGLHPMELLFVEAYCGVAQFRAAKAYEIAGYKTTGGASRANASRLLLKERVAAAINARLGARVKALRIMDGDEALEGISQLARSDIRLVFPENSWVRKLPDDVAVCIKSIRPGKHGYTIELYPKDHALEVMAKVSGRLKETVKVEHTLEEIMALANQPQQGTAA